MKFLYLADTHIGGNDHLGYRRQPRCLRHFPEIMQCLDKFIRKTGDIDFILHGGDMVDAAMPDTIDLAADLFRRLPCPAFLVPGNHDLTVPGAVEMWLKHAPQFFPDNRPDFRITGDGVRIDALCCNWGPVPFCWSPDQPQTPWLSPEQWERIAHPSDEMRIVALHSPVYGILPEQYGGREPIHAPAGDFTERFQAVTDHTALVLGAHTHVNTVITRRNCRFATVSAFSEIPFEFKVIEISRRKLSMRTFGLGGSVPFDTRYASTNAAETLTAGSTSEPSRSGRADGWSSPPAESTRS